jgi:hypothetical protein
MEALEPPSSSLEELHEAELEYLDLMFVCGVPIAVPAAMHYCAKHGLNAPQRLTAEAAKMLFAELRGDAPKERGRSSGIINRYRQDAIDYMRWDAVIEIRERREHLRKEINELGALRGRKARNLLNERTALLHRVGTNSYDVFACASLLLAETPARGGQYAIKQSYLKVRKNIHNLVKAKRYHVLDPRFLRLFDSDRGQPDSPG